MAAGDDLNGPAPSGPPTTDVYGGAVWGGQRGKAEEDVARYRAMGLAAAGRAPVNIDYGQANGAIGSVYGNAANSLLTRGQQDRATGMLMGAASGSAPSAAALRSRMATEQGLRAQLAGNAAGRGQLGQTAATRAALLNAGVFGQQNVGNSAQARAQEIGSAQNALGTHLGAVRTGDYTDATGMSRLGALQGDMAAQQGSMAFRQNELNQAYQQQMENSAFGVRNASQEALLHSRARDLGVQQFQYENDQFDNEMTKKWLTSLTGGVTSMGSAMIAGGGAGGGGGAPSMGAAAGSSTPSGGDIYRGDPYGSPPSYGDVYGQGYGGGYDPSFRGNF